MTREEIIAKVHEVVALANRKFNIDLPMPTVEFFTKGRNAGWAAEKRNTLSFNITLAAHNPDTFYQTVIHEVAHLVTWRVYPRAKQNHGPEFKYVDVALGGRGKRCHSYDVSVSKVKRSYTRYVCACDCKEHYLTAKVAAQASSYRCRKCNTRLTNTGKTKVIKK